MNLLINEPPLQVLPSLASLIGLNESIVLQQVHYWLRKTTFKLDGKKWFYKTYESWQEEFPFWSMATIRRTINNLEKLGLIISTNKYNKMKFDKTKWYTIDYENYQQLMSSQFAENELSSCSDCTEGLLNLNNCTTQDEYANNQRIIQRNTTENYFVDDKEGKQPARKQSINNEDVADSEFNLQKDNQPNDITSKLPKTENVLHSSQTIGKKEHEPSIFEFYEQNGFGALSPYIAEKIGAWIDDLNEELVLEAMKLAIEHNVRSWKYVESILKNWHNKNLKSINDVMADQKRFEEKKKRKIKHKEPVPEWFYHRNQLKEEECRIDFEEERRKVLEKIGRL